MTYSSLADLTSTTRCRALLASFPFSIVHPRESDEWRGMSLRQKYEFFAPIWRVMRDDNMSVDEVQRQVEYVALAVKQGSQVRGRESTSGLGVEQELLLWMLLPLGRRCIGLAW